MKAIRKIWLGILMASCVLAAAVLRATPVKVVEQGSNFQNIQVLTVMTDREIQQTMQGGIGFGAKTMIDLAERFDDYFD